MNVNNRQWSLNHGGLSLKVSLGLDTLVGRGIGGIRRLVQGFRLIGLGVARGLRGAIWELCRACKYAWQVCAINGYSGLMERRM